MTKVSNNTTQKDNAHALALLSKSDGVDDNSNIKSSDHKSPTIIIDSLPYIDYIHPDYEAYALSLIEHEMQKNDEQTTATTRTTQLHEKCNSYQLQLPNDNNFLFNAPISQKEYKQLESRDGEPHNSNRNSSSNTFKKIIHEPQQLLSSFTSNEENKKWKDSIKELKIEIEKQRHININLQLQQIFESGQWRMYNASLEEVCNKYQAIANDKKRKIDEINALRASKQEGIHDKLMKFSGVWSDIIMKHCKLVLATDSLENDVKKRRLGLGILDDDDGKNNDDVLNGNDA